MKCKDLMIISGYYGMRATIERCCALLDVEPTIIEWEIANEEIIRKLEQRFLNEGMPQIIISRGALANLVKQAFPEVTVLRVEPDDMDILDAFEDARNYGNRMGLIQHVSRGQSCRINILKRVLHLEELRIYQFETGEDIARCVREGKRDGMHAMVGGGTLAGRVGREVDIPVFFAATGQRVIEEQMQNAMNMLGFRSEEREKAVGIRNSLELLHEGILVVENGVVSAVNQVLIDLLFVSRNELSIGKDIKNLFQEIFPQEVADFLLVSGKQEMTVSLRGKSFTIRKEGKSDGRLTIILYGEEQSRQIQKNRATLRDKGLLAKHTFQDITGFSDVIIATKKEAKRYALTDANIMIVGESGTGKELFAQSIHNAGPRRLKPFVAVNCAAIPETLLESELFGYEEGAFSGARKGGSRGLFELAHEGTLFLDEIDSIPVHLQGVLLRAVQEKEVRRVGSRHTWSIDVRIISATNRDLRQMIKEGVFRADLYYRLNTLNLHIPPLRDRREDILPLTEKFLQHYASRYGKETPVLTQADKTVLQEVDWMGNVRSLENVVHRYVVLHGDGTVMMEDCLVEKSHKPMKYAREEKNLQDLQYAVIRKVLEENGGNKTKTAKQLGISRSTLWKKLREHGYADMIP